MGGDNMSYAGSLKFDTRIDTKGFNRGTTQINKQVNSMSASIGRLGKMVALAFGVKQITNFAKESVKLASSLQEVQNVVDVTFGNLSYKIDEFAKTSIDAFGLSELSTKKYASSLGAMFKSMGLGESEVLNMSMNLTRLSADLASFYNLGNEEAFTKIISGMSGETEPLKRLGVDLRVANLEAFALSQGITKAYSAMNSAEKAMLTYNYLMQATADAQGDFARTYDSWENQSRVFAERINVLKGHMGNLLIHVLFPMLKALNVMLARLNQIGEMFTHIFGGKSASSGGIVQDSIAIEDSIGGTVDNMADVTEEAKKTGKATNNLLGGFDEVNTLTKDMGESGDIAGGVVGSDMSGIIDSTQSIDEIDKISDSLQRLIDRANELKEIFMSGFNAFITIDANEAKTQLENIKQTILEIFSDGMVQSALDGFIESFVYMLGANLGVFINMGLAIAENITTGIAQALENNKEFIKQRLVNIFNVGTEISNLFTEFIGSIGRIFTTWVTSDNAKGITTSIASIFATAFLSITELAGKIGRDMLGLIATPIIENEDIIVEAIDSMLGGVNSVLKTFADSTKETWQSILTNYDRDVSPAFKNFEKSFSWLVSAFVGGYNKHMKPTIDKLSKRFDEVFKGSIQPLINTTIEIFGKLIYIVSILWKNVFSPFLEFLVNKFVKDVSYKFEAMGSVFILVVDIITRGLNELLNFINVVLDGIIQFSKDWGLIWNACKDATNNALEGIKRAWGTVAQWFTSNVFNPLERGFKGVVNSIAGMAEFFANVWVRAVNTVINALNSISVDIPDWVPGMGGKSWGVNLRRMSEVRLPRLAKGAVIPPNAEFMAILGDQKRGVNIETPLETMIDAFKTALSDMGGTGKEIVLEVDGMRIARAMLPELTREMKRMGVSAI